MLEINFTVQNNSESVNFVTEVDDNNNKVSYGINNFRDNGYG